MIVLFALGLTRRCAVAGLLIRLGEAASQSPGWSCHWQPGRAIDPAPEDQPDAKRIVLFLVGTGLVLTSDGRADRAGRRYRADEHRLQVLLAGLDVLSVCAGAALGWMLPALHDWRPVWRGVWKAGFTCAGGWRGALSADGDHGQDRRPHATTVSAHPGWHGLHGLCAPMPTNGARWTSARTTAPSAGCKRMSKARR